MTKSMRGVLFGILVGLVDLVPMILQGLTWDANFSAFFSWVVSGFFVASSHLGVRGPTKGIIVSFLILLPSAILIGWHEPLSLVPVTFMTIILGCVLGYLIDGHKSVLV